MVETSSLLRRLDFRELNSEYAERLPRASIDIKSALTISKREVRFERRPKNRWQALTENIDPTVNSHSSSSDVSQGKKEEEKNG